MDVTRSREADHGRWLGVAISKRASTVVLGNSFTSRANVEFERFRFPVVVHTTGSYAIGSSVYGSIQGLFNPVSIVDATMEYERRSRTAPRTLKGIPVDDTFFAPTDRMCRFVDYFVSSLDSDLKPV
ncbi:hypothetical protein LC1Hm_0276 [Halomicrobium sp. LC1Hm]|nr:hypothetical protein LC1Hm_0276 [Halomicrobium sp. LC1Hm]